MSKSTTRSHFTTSGTQNEFTKDYLQTARTPLSGCVERQRRRRRRRRGQQRRGARRAERLALAPVGAIRLALDGRARQWWPRREEAGGVQQPEQPEHLAQVVVDRLGLRGDCGTRHHPRYIKRSYHHHK